jgi:sugar lactone lactonase YvrE
MAVPTGTMVISGLGLATPESVLHDTVADVYLVSNVAGAPLDKDDNGFVSRFTPSGELLDLKWIDAGADEVTLSAPKGMAIVEDTLYVTDIDTVRLFDRASGAPKGEIAVEGATFLNDLAPAPMGGVYLTDTGMKAGESGFEPSGSAAVYHVDAEGRVHTLLKGDDLGAPNGIRGDVDRVLVVTYGANELYAIVDGERKVLASLPAGSLDGLERLPDGRVAVTSWEGQAVYIGPVEGPFETLVDQIQAPADLGIDIGRGRLLIPRFMDDEVVIQPIP